MNPYDPNTEPGTHFVADTLGVSNVSMLNTTHRPSNPLYRAATQVIKAAYELNERHALVTVAAQDALRLLEPVGRGELSGARVSYAILRTSVPKLGELLTKQDRAYTQLVEAISAYQRLQRDPDTEHSTTKAHEANRERRSGRDDDWAIVSSRRSKWSNLAVCAFAGPRSARSPTSLTGRAGAPSRCPRPSAGWSPTGYCTRTPARTLPARTTPLAHVPRRGRPSRDTYGDVARVRRPRP